MNSVDWNNGMEWWSGLLEWSTGLDYWGATPTIVEAHNTLTLAVSFPQT